MRTLGVSVSAENLPADFQEKLKGALVSAFGEGISLNFQTEEETEEEKARREKEEKEKKDKEEGHMKEMSVLQETVTRLEKQVGLVPQLQAGLQKATEATEKVQKEFTEYKEQVQRERGSLHTQEINQFISEAKAAGRILPANEASAREMLIRADRNKIVKFSKDGKEVEMSEFDMVKGFLGSLQKVVSFTEVSPSGIGNGDLPPAMPVRIFRKGEAFDVADIDLDQRVRSYAQEHNVPYEEALLAVSAKEGRQQ